MGSITVSTAEDLPYGPGNPDYERDGMIAEQDDDERDALENEHQQQQINDEAR